MKTKTVAKSLFALGLGAAIWGSLAPSLAMGQTQQAPIPPAACAKRADIVENLSKQFRESQIARGLTDSGGLAEVWSAGPGGTWTLFLSLPNGMACLFGTGSDWQTKPYEAPKPEEKPL